jgi:hypothetical protein
VLAACCCLALGAADYYARVPLASPAYTDLQTLSSAHLLPERQGQQYALLRLEMAMLLQSALPNYYAEHDAGHSIDPAAEAALKRLVKEYGPELAGLGVELQPPFGPASASRRPAGDAAWPDAPEEEADAPAAPAAKPAPRPHEPEVLQVVAPAPPVSSAPLAVDRRSNDASDVSTRPAARPGLLAPAPAAADPAVRPAIPEETAAQRPAGRTPAGGAPPEERDLNLLLDRRTEQLGNVAESVEQTGHPALEDFMVEDNRLGPVRPYHEELPVDVKVFGDLRGQAYWRDTRQPVGHSNAAGLRLYWADAGIDFSHQSWGARVTLNYNDDTRQPKLHELWAQYQSDSGAYARAGRVILPFADRKGDFPTFSSARELGFSSVNGAGIGWNKPDWGASAWVYDPGSSAAGGGSTNLSEFALSLSLFQADCEDDSDGWRVALAYLSELGGAEHNLAPGVFTQAVPGLNLAAGWDWGCGRYHLNLDYAGATRRFAAADLDANGDGRGDQPQALNVDFLFTPDSEQLYGLRFEHTSGFAGAAANRWSAMYGRWLSDQLLARLELSRGQYNDYTPGKRHDIGMNADVRLVF